MNVLLTDIEARVLGCLIEKEITTPENYPLSLNSLTAACNQKSNRHPEMALDETTVVQAVDNLRFEHHMCWHVTVPGSRVPKYKHDIQSKWKFSPQELAVLCELLVRGPQTVGELRVRCERMHKFSGIEEVEATLNELSTRPDGPLVVKLQREPGRKEPRFAHLLSGEAAAVQNPAEPPPEPARIKLQSENERLQKIEQELASLRAEMEAMRAQFTEFRKQFE